MSSTASLGHADFGGTGIKGCLFKAAETKFGASMAGQGKRFASQMKAGVPVSLKAEKERARDQKALSSPISKHVRPGIRWQEYFGGRGNPGQYLTFSRREGGGRRRRKMDKKRRWRSWPKSLGRDPLPPLPPIPC